MKALVPLVLSLILTGCVSQTVTVRARTAFLQMSAEKPVTVNPNTTAQVPLR